MTNTCLFIAFYHAKIPLFFFAYTYKIGKRKKDCFVLTSFKENVCRNFCPKYLLVPKIMPIFENHRVGSTDHFQESTVLTMIHYCFHSHLICLDKWSVEPTPWSFQETRNFVHVDKTENAGTGRKIRPVKDFKAFFINFISAAQGSSPLVHINAIQDPPLRVLNCF